METVRKRKKRKKEETDEGGGIIMSVSENERDAKRERDGGTDTERERGARHAMGTQGNKRTNNYSSVSFLHSPSSLFLSVYPSLLLLLTQHRGIRQPVYAAPQRLNGITKQEASNLCMVRGSTHRTGNLRTGIRTHDHI